MSFLDSILGSGEDTTGRALRQTEDERQQRARAAETRIDRTFGEGYGPLFDRVAQDSFDYEAPLIDERASRARQNAMQYQSSMENARAQLLQNLTGTIDLSAAINNQMAQTGRAITPAYNPVGDVLSTGIGIAANNEYARAAGGRGLGYSIFGFGNDADYQRINSVGGGAAP